MSFFENNIAFVRHGETEWNLQEITQGQLNSPLTHKGILQAGEIIKELKDYKFNLVVSSPLGRAMETSKIIAKGLNIPQIKKEASFAERNLGILQGHKKEESLKKFPFFWDVNGVFIQNSKITNAESIDEFLKRVQGGVKKLKTLSKNKKIVVVTHDGVLHAIISYIKGIDFDKMHKFYKFNHCDPIILK